MRLAELAQSAADRAESSWLKQALLAISADHFWLAARWGRAAIDAGESIEDVTSVLSVVRSPAASGGI